MDGELPMATNQPRMLDNRIGPSSRDPLSGSNINNRLTKEQKERQLKNLEKSENDIKIFNKKNDEKKDKGNDPLIYEKKIEFMKPNGLFAYQTMIEFHHLYSILYFILEILVFIYKNANFTYPKSAFGIEISNLVFYLIIQLTRLFFASVGNRTETSLYIIFSLAFSAGVAYTYAYFWVMQTYSLKFEIIINIIGVALWVIETIFAIFTFLSTSKQESGL